MGFEVIDHTADIGIRVSSDTRERLFRDAADGLMALIVDAESVRPSRETSISIDGTDDTDMLINWLRELLYLWSGRQWLFHGIRSLKWEKNRMNARVAVDSYSPGHHHIINDIKAVTYHQAEVARVGDKWRAQIIFDV